MSRYGSDERPGSSPSEYLTPARGRAGSAKPTGVGMLTAVGKLTGVGKSTRVDRTAGGGTGDGGYDSGARYLHRLKIIGIVLPVAFIVLLEFVRFKASGTRELANDHLVLAAVSVVSIIAFGSVMFYLIDRAHRLILRQNRELAAVNAVSTAVRGSLGVDQIIDSALESVLASTGAVEASVTATDPTGRPPYEKMTTWRRSAPAGPEPSAATVLDAPAGGPAGDLRVVDIALTTGTSRIGTMRLRLPARHGEPDRLTADTLCNIGQQVGSAIQTAQLVADLQRRKHEGHALYDVLLKISHQSSPVETLMPVVRYARDLLGSDEAVLCLNEATSRSIQIDGPISTASPADGPMCIAPGAVQVRGDHARVCPVRSSLEYRATLSVPLDGPGGPFGSLWIGRRSGAPFTERDEGYLVTLSEIAVIAISSARMRENERQGAILAERERIARELHDSLAQVLGVTHLRLRAVEGDEQISAVAEVRAELAELADICHDAYGDVREAILGLRESSRIDRALLDGLQAYLDKFSRQSGIAVSLVGALDRDLALSPRSEVHLIRVIQEALTNVRKHAGARSVVVRVSRTASETTFVVEDDGHGFDMTEVPPDRDGYGLHSMRERMRLLNGNLTIDSAPGRGTRIIARVPEGGRATSITVLGTGGAQGAGGIQNAGQVGSEAVRAVGA